MHSSEQDTRQLQWHAKQKIKQGADFNMKV
jgi:hypothetical protein